MGQFVRIKQTLIKKFPLLGGMQRSLIGSSLTDRSSGRTTTTVDGGMPSQSPGRVRRWRRRSPSGMSYRR